MNEIVQLKNLSKGKNSHSKNSPQPQIWVIASGKGGVGKTFIASSLGITLSRLGKKVTLVDADFGGANLHTFLGKNPSPMNIRYFFEGKKNLQEITEETALPRLSLIQGVWESWNPLDVSLDQSMIFMKALKSLKTDIIILDTSSGGHMSNLEFLRTADQRIIVSNTEPCSIEKTYRLIENFICHVLKAGSTPEDYQQLIELLRKQRTEEIFHTASFKTYLEKFPGIDISIFNKINSNPPNLIINSSRSHLDQDLGYSIRSVANKYFDLNIEYLSAINYDNAVWQASRTKEPVLIAQPFTPLTGQFTTICKHLVKMSSMMVAV
jgi:flagellar biosynthesis protein FlhG